VDSHDESVDQEKLSKIANVASYGETQPAPPQASERTPSQPNEELGKKRKVAP
jgi:hypothetical protein